MKKTPFHPVHLEQKAKMVPFGGWDMPVQFSSLLIEHEWTRTHAGLFDVSHMGEIFVTGSAALEALQVMTCNDISKMQPGQVQYNALINADGGVVDDITVYFFEENSYMLCVNAANIDKDFEFVSGSLPDGKDVTAENESDKIAQIALQGPEAEEVLAGCQGLAALAGSLSLADIGYYRFTRLEKNGVIISRTGYTGEDGFEIYGEPEFLMPLYRELLAHEKVKPIGLGARDTLRLEARYPLYGHELDDRHSIVEGGQAWIVKDKTPAPVRQSVLLEQKQGKNIEAKIRPFILLDPGVARADHAIVDSSDNQIGTVTSGSYSPSLKKSIGLARLPVDLDEAAIFFIKVRDKKLKAALQKGPFIETRAGKK